MKRLSILFLFLFATTIAKAQQAGQLYITSYDDTGQIEYICNGVTLDSIPIGFGLVNLIQSVPLKIDSIAFSGDSNSFHDLQTLTYSWDFEITNASYVSSPVFYPSLLGNDTLHITGYYNGQFTATAAIIFHAQSSPNLSMFGYTLTTAYLVDGNGFGGTNQEAEADTMHDEITNGNGYYSQTGPFGNGGNEFGDQPVVLQTCGAGAIIDSIYESGDFSEFAFDSFPKLPYTIPSDDSLVLNYQFTPQVVDETGSRHHYLIFHSTDGNYLTWSFEYKVYPASSVSETPTTGNEIKVFPNPATDALQILGGQTGTIHLFDIMGRERMTANNDGTSTTLDVSRLELGIYFLREGNQSTKVEISR